jgi:hypothetical protein
LYDFDDLQQNENKESCAEMFTDQLAQNKEEILFFLYFKD